MRLYKRHTDFEGLAVALRVGVAGRNGPLRFSLAFQAFFSLGVSRRGISLSEQCRQRTEQTQYAN